jgi:P pilus assembly chaperone PapD
MRSLGPLGRSAAGLWRAAAVAALALLPTLAAGVTVAPVQVEVSPAHPVQTVVVSNQSDRPMRFQVQVLAWTQRDGADQRVPSDDLVVAPAITDIPAGGKQIFRIATRVPAEGVQRAYRLVLEDISAAAPGQGEVGVTLRVNHDLPVFVSAADASPARLTMGPCATPTPACVRVGNTGARHGVVRSFGLGAAGTQGLMTVNTRILPGAWREWTVALPGGATATQLRATTGDGELHWSPAAARN